MHEDEAEAENLGLEATLASWPRELNIPGMVVTG